MRRGWTSRGPIDLPLGWELREDDHCFYLYDFVGTEHAYGPHTPMCVIEAFAWFEEWSKRCNRP